MEQEKGKKKLKISPEQVEKACKKMGETASAVDNTFDNAKKRFGPLGSAIGFGVIATLVLALINSPGLVWIFLIMICLGAAPMIHKKMKELKVMAETRAAENAKEKEKEAASTEEKK